MGPLLAEFRHQTAFYVARMAFCAAWTAFCVAQTAFRFHRQGRCFHALGSLKACSWHTDGILRGLGDILCGPDAFLSGPDGTKGPPELRQHGRGVVICLFLASPNSILYSLYQYNSTTPRILGGFAPQTPRILGGFAPQTPRNLGSSAPQTPRSTDWRMPNPVNRQSGKPPIR